jgi:hypothetical protein
VIRYDALDPLPVRGALPGLNDSLEAHGTAVLVAPPGTGKTTLVPLALAGLLDEGRGVEFHRGRSGRGGAGGGGVGGVAVVSVDRGCAGADHQCVGAGGAGDREVVVRAGWAAG